MQGKELEDNRAMKSCYNFYGSKCTFDTTANGWRLPDGVEYSFLHYAWGRDDSYLRLARNAI
jgi:hypothetical protein